MIYQVAALEKNFMEMKRALNKITNQVNKLEEQLEMLNQKFELAMSERKRLEEETAIMMRRLAAADKLINGLSSETERWVNMMILIMIIILG